LNVGSREPEQATAPNIDSSDQRHPNRDFFGVGQLFNAFTSKSGSIEHANQNPALYKDIFRSQTA
jgi:hypothetical protein